MLTNYFRTAIRHLSRHKGYTVLNVTGLALGLACCLIIYLFVRHETSYDRFHEHADRIARVSMTWVFDETELPVAQTTTKPGPMLTEMLPDVLDFVRLRRASSSTLRIGTETYLEEGLVYADSGLFAVFSFPLLLGDARTALSQPNTVVLTQHAARKYFGNEDPVGQTIVLNGSDVYAVTGVIADVPPNSHIQFDVAASFASLPEAESRDWNSSGYHTYLLLTSADAFSRVREGMATVFEEEFEGWSNTPALQLMPLTEVYLHSAREGEWSPEGDVRRVYVFAAIALLVLLIACINYMNLSTARAVDRAREVGMRKVLGAQRWVLMSQFVVEALLVTGLGFVFALGIVAAVLPAFSSFSGKALSWNAGEGLQWVPVLWLGVSLVAGSYPAFVLSQFKPVKVLKGRFSASSSGVGLRKGLVVFQFAISIFLIVSTLVIERQVRFIADIDLGYDQEHVVVLPIDRSVRPQVAAIKQSMRQSASVRQVAATSHLPINGVAGRTFNVGTQEEERQLINTMEVDADFIDAMGVDLIRGLPFVESDYGEAGESCSLLLNETAVGHFGWTGDEVVGQVLHSMALGGQTCTIKGVVADFHFDSLHKPIEPLIMVAGNAAFHLLVRTEPGDVRVQLAELRSAWGQVVPQQPFSYEFLDQEYEAVYRSEQRTGQLFTVFSLFAVFIACLGLLGLTAFAVMQRTKEIGIRKVLGASVPSLAMLLSREFVVLVGLAFMVATPVAYLAMDQWLDAFAYRTTVGPGLFLLSGVAALALTLLTVGYHTIRAATDDPIQSLRYE